MVLNALAAHLAATPYGHVLWEVWKHFSDRREATLSSDSSVILEWTFDDLLTIFGFQICEINIRKHSAPHTSTDKWPAGQVLLSS